MDLLQLLTQDNYLMYSLDLAKALGINEAILIGELARKYNYWKMNGRLTEDGFFFITQSDIERDTALSPHKQSSAFSKLADLGIVIIDKKGGMDRSNYYKVNTEVLGRYFNKEVEDVKETRVMDDINSTNPLNIRTFINECEPELADTLNEWYGALGRGLSWAQISAKVDNLRTECAGDIDLMNKQIRNSFMNGYKQFFAPKVKPKTSTKTEFTKKETSKKSFYESRGGGFSVPIDPDRCEDLVF